MTLTVYDKNFQITRKGQTIGNETDGTNILRIELSMKRNAYYRALKLKPGKKLSYDAILHKLYKHGSKLIRKHMENLFPCDGKHLPYQKAKRRIEKKITNKKTQEKMLYLLEKMEYLEEALQSRVNNRRDTEPKVYQKNENIIQLIREYSLKIFSQTAIHAS